MQGLNPRGVHSITWMQCTMYLVSTELFVMYDFDRQSKRLHIVPSIILYTDSRSRDIYMIGRQCDRQKAGTEYVTS